MLGGLCHKQWARFTGRLAVGLLVLCGILSAGEHAQSAPRPKPSGSVNIHQVQVAFIGSGAVGGGSSHPFKLGGPGIGVSTLDATGSVYNLSRLQDLEGVYGQARVGWAVGEQGKGDMWLQNANGVYLRLKARCQGLALSLGADGMVVRRGT